MEGVSGVRLDPVSSATGTAPTSQPQQPVAQDSMESGNPGQVSEGCWSGLGRFFSSVVWFFGAVITFVKERFFCWCFGRSDHSVLKAHLQELLNAWNPKIGRNENAKNIYNRLPAEAKTEIDTRIGKSFLEAVEDKQLNKSIGATLTAYIATFE